METTITEHTNQTQTYQLEFFGKGSDYFSIMIVNWLLILVTLGLYYPWARAKRLKYIFGNTSLNNERFHFSGTGKEMFKGFVKLMLFYIVAFGVYIFLLMKMHMIFVAVIFLYLAILAIIPFAIHGSLKYRMSRTSYRGIRFGYRGSFKTLGITYLKGLLFTILTLGIYGAWLQMNIRSYTFSNIRYGDAQFTNESNGGEWLLLNLKGYFLTILTLGIYLFWWQRDIFSYYIDNMSIAKNDQKIEFNSTATAGDFFNLFMINFLIVVVTLGFGAAWTEMRTQKFLCDKINLEGNINIQEINQTEEEYTNALGEDVMDFFDFDLDLA